MVNFIAKELVIKIKQSSYKMTTFCIVTFQGKRKDERIRRLNEDDEVCIAYSCAILC